MMKNYKLVLSCVLLSVSVVAFCQKRYERGVLLELYTGQLCANCPLATDGLKQITASYEDDSRLVWISHHAGYFSDSLTIKESYDLSVFCGISGAPALVYNRSLCKFGSGLPKLDQSVSNFSAYNDYYVEEDEEGRTFIGAELGQDADVSLDLYTSYDETSGKLRVTAYGEKNELFEASAPALSVFLVQDSYVGMQNMGLGEVNYSYIHRNSVRHMLSSYYLGDFISFDGEGRYSVSYEYIIPEEIDNFDAFGRVGNVSAKTDPEHMFVAAFISNREEGYVDNPNYYRDNIEVYNAVKCKLNSKTASVRNTGMENICLRVEGGRVVVDGYTGKCRVDVFTATGQAVDNIGLGHGIYVVRAVADDGNVVIRKIAVD